MPLEIRMCMKEKAYRALLMSHLLGLGWLNGYRNLDLTMILDLMCHFV